MTFPVQEPYVKWSDRKKLEKTALRQGKPLVSEPPRRPRRRKPPAGACCPCGVPLVRQQSRFCSRSCMGKAGRQALLEWERSVANGLRAEGWNIFTPSTCCDRIGIRDGKVYFLEFKPEGKRELRTLQRAVQEILPEMYLVVEGTRAGAISTTHHQRAKKHQHMKKRPGVTSRFVGVSWAKDKGKWRAKIMIHGNLRHLGFFDTEEQAARAYSDAQRF